MAIQETEQTIFALASGLGKAGIAVFRISGRSAIKAYEVDHKNYIDSSRKILEAIGNYVYENLNSNNVLINKPQGGFYLMPEFISAKFNTSSDMCRNILEMTGVALLPGSDFGFDEKRMIARLSFTDFDGKILMEK